MITRLFGLSFLSPLRPGLDWRPALDEAADLTNVAGYTPILRVFCGELPWCGQTRSHVYDRLPRLLEDFRARRQHALLSYVTEAGLGYPLEEHVDELELITAHYQDLCGLKEVANEAFHPSQGGRLSPERCRDLAARMRGSIAWSCAEDDESLTYAGGAWVPIHRDRGRDPLNQVRRIREQQAVALATRKPTLDQEAIGADDQPERGRRESDPAIFLAQGLLNRLFETDGVIGHSQNGLHAARLSPQQHDCLLFLRIGLTVWRDPAPLTYYNTRHTPDSAPFKNADLRDDDPSSPYYNPGGSVCRLDAGIHPDARHGLAVGLFYGGDEGAWRIETQHGWRVGKQLIRLTGANGTVVAWEVER